MTKLTTSAFKAHTVQQIIESVDEDANTSYYVFAAQHVPRTSNTIPAPSDMTRTTTVDVYNKMLFGKRIAPNDIKPMIRSAEWTTGTKYAMYDDTDADLLTKDFFVYVNETAYLHVYKCLDNNMNAESTAVPTFSHVVNSNTNMYQTSDGYRWKYMYSITRTEYDQFATSKYIPVVANTDVESYAVRGAIDVIKVEDGGRQYNNYTSGTFVGLDLRIGGNSALYQVQNNTVKTTNGYYTGCIMYLSAGDGAGQYKTIANNFSNTTGTFVVVNSAFSTPPQNGTTFEINPEVVVTGDGLQTTNAVARALVNATASNSVYRVEMLNRGANYQYHVANVVANAVVGVSSTANVRPIYAPADGHGANSMVELGAEHFCFGINFANSEANTIPILNSYEQIGILKDPVFANVAFTYSSANGTFQNGEMVHKIKPVRVAVNATMNTTSNTLSSNTADFENQFSPGDYVYLKASNNAAHMLSTVVSITSNSALELDSIGTFACTDILIYKANTSANAIVQGTTNTTHMTFSNVSGVFGISDLYVGKTTGAKAVVETVIRNDVTKGFDTFIQMHKYTGSMSSGTFTQNELVYQGVDANTSTANGFIHSADIDGGVATIFLTNQIGVFDTTGSMEGNTSSASASLTNKYSPELLYGSGDVLMLENINAVTRANNQSESLKILFEF